MNALVNWLLLPAITIWDTPLSNAECLGFISGVICVWLTAKQNIWNFPIGILNCALLFFLFFEQRLFADAGLQIFFIVLGFNWLMVSGNAQQCLAQAVEFIEQNLKTTWQFSPKW